MLHADEIVGASSSDGPVFSAPMAAPMSAAAPQPVDLGTTIRNTRSIWRGLNVKFALV